MHDTQRKVDQLRKTLRHGGGGPAAAGPFREGLSDYESIQVASFPQPDAARRFRDALRQAGVASELRPDRGHGQTVLVDVKDRDSAAVVLAEQRRRHPDLFETPPRRRHSATLAGALIALVAGMTLCAGSTPGWHYFALPVGYGLIGAAVGRLFDRLIWRIASDEQLVVRTADILLAAWVIPLAIYLFHLLPDVVK